LNLAVAFAAGTALGLAAAVVQEKLDNTLKSQIEVERFLNLPALPSIPSVSCLTPGKSYYGLLVKAVQTSDKPVSSESKLWHRIGDHSPYSAALSEMISGLRTSILLSSAEQPPSTLLFTSAHGGEGKTTLAGNFAISLGQLGRRILLIDADMRNPNIENFFHLERCHGLVDWLSGQNDWRDLVHTTAGSEVSVIGCGQIPPNPAELLSSERMRRLIDEASREYDFVIIDSPPLLPVADSRILATLVRGVVLVVKGGQTTRESAWRATNHLRAVGAKLIGVVLNNTRDNETSPQAYYHYQSNGNGRS
jgi:capsular exopolysaccharide synthesis family protein